MSIPCRAVMIPGAPGTDGVDGTQGPPGQNAWTITLAAFVMPAIGSSVIVEVENSDWMVPEVAGIAGQVLAVEFAGSLTVVAIIDSTHVELRNDGVTGNAPAGAAIPSSARVGVSGAPGATGGSPGGYLLAANNLSDVADVPTSRSSLGLGTLAIQNTVNDGDWSGTDLAVTNGGTGASTAAGARTNLGLTLGVADTNIAPVNDGAGLTAGELLRATATGIESITNAAAAVQLGLGGGVGAWAVYENQQLSGTSGGTFTQAGWRVVPLNVEAVDTAAIASIAGNTVTLAAAGTYRIRWRVPAYAVDRFQSALYNVSTTSIIAYGSNAFAAAADTTGDTSFGSWRITCAALTQLQLWGWCELTGTGSGFGLANFFGGTEVYASLEIEKET